MISQATDKEIHLNISKWGLICGLNDGTDPLMKIVITDFLRTFHNERTLDYISQAFKLYAAQKLDFKDPVYNNMNPTFIGKVLTAYAEHLRKEELKQRAEPKEVKMLQEPKVTKEERDAKRESAYNFILDIYKKEGKMPLTANWVHAFNHMYATELYQPTQEEFDKEVELMKMGIKSELRRKKTERLKTLFEEKQLKDEDGIIIQVKKNIVQKYIRGL